MAICCNLYRKLLLPTSSEEFKILEEGPLRASVEVGTCHVILILQYIVCCSNYNGGLLLKIVATTVVYLNVTSLLFHTIKP